MKPQWGVLIRTLYHENTYRKCRGKLRYCSGKLIELLTNLVSKYIENIEERTNQLWGIKVTYTGRMGLWYE